ncbi:MAG: HAMP domain-containing sensor histidine kinase [Bacteroidales bacterium]
MKRSRGRHRAMLLLMGGSLLLLTAFVAYWLAGQFRQTRERLLADMRMEYSVIHQHLVDSLILRDIVVPSLADSVTVRIDLNAAGRLFEGSDSLERMFLESPGARTLILGTDSITRLEVLPDSLAAVMMAPGNVRRLHVPPLPEGISGDGDSLGFHWMGADSAKALILAPGAREFQVYSEADSIRLPGEVDARFLRSVQLFIHKTDELFREEGDTVHFPLDVAEEDLLKALDARNRQMEWDVTLRFTDSSDAPFAGPDRILIWKDLPPIHIHGLLWQVLGDMWPQILFALLLLGISAAALGISYRSFREQLVLHRLRDDFIRNITHELKTPVSTVKVALEALTQFDFQNNEATRREYLDLAGKEVRRLEDLISKVLGQMALEEQQAGSSLESVDLEAFMDEVLLRLAPRIDREQAEVTRTTPEERCPVRADPVHLEGVLMNLLDNSLKYAGPRPQIRLGVRCIHDRTELWVSDNGPGIPREHAARIFDKFFRVPTGDRHDVKGHGLGLHFSRLAMRQFGGDIRQENPPGGGCAFVLTFPKTEPGWQ